MPWFFAYASWTDPDVMPEPGARFVKAMLPDYVYTFCGEHATFSGGTSTVVPMPGGTVLGVAYALTEPEVERVRQASLHHRVVEVQAKVEGEVVPVLMLVPSEAGSPRPPSEAYVAVVRRSLMRHYAEELVDLYLTRAVKRATGEGLVASKVPTPDTFKPEYGGDFRRLFPWGVTRQNAFGSAWMVIHPGDSSTPHNHDEEETFIFLNGQGVMSVDGERFPVGKGDAVYLEPFSAHMVQNVGSDPLEVLCIWWGGMPVA